MSKSVAWNLHCTAWDEDISVMFVFLLYKG